MKQKFQFMLVMLCITNLCFSQLNPEQDKRYRKYSNEEWNGSKLSKVIDEVKFKPIRRDAEGNVDIFKMALLSMSDLAYQQINIDANYLCATKYDDYFDLWNFYYTKISLQTWDRLCKALICLMLVDKTAKVRN